MTCPACNRPVATAAQVAAVETGAEWMNAAACYLAALDLDPFCDGEIDAVALLALARNIPQRALREMARRHREPGKPVVYLAHPVGAATVEGVRANLARAKRWLWALRCATDWSICAPWIPAVEAVMDAGAAEHDERARGLADDLAVVERCDAIVMVGGRVSSGMAMERDHAAARGMRVIDGTDHGEEPLAWAVARIAAVVMTGEETGR